MRLKHPLFQENLVGPKGIGIKPMIKMIRLLLKENAKTVGTMDIIKGLVNVPELIQTHVQILKLEVANLVQRVLEANETKWSNKGWGYNKVGVTIRATASHITSNSTSAAGSSGARYSIIGNRGVRGKRCGGARGIVIRSGGSGLNNLRLVMV